MRPYDVKKADQLIGMESDNFPPNPNKWSILHSGETISLHPPSGRGFVVIPRNQFNAIVDWYLRDQNVREEEDVTEERRE